MASLYAIPAVTLASQRVNAIPSIEIEIGYGYGWYGYYGFEYHLGSTEYDHQIPRITRTSSFMNARKLAFIDLCVVRYLGPAGVRIK